MRKLSNQIRAAMLGVGVMLAMAAAVRDTSVAIALGVAAFVAFGGLSAGRNDRPER